ncbi:MAG: hypothetical protein ACODAD_00400 [Planctomycetota bacterium]
MSEDFLTQRRHCRVVVFFRMPLQQVKIELPAEVQLRLLNGYGIGGIVLRQRRAIYSSLIPGRLVTSESALHFLSAIQMRKQRVKTGALVMRYDTSSRLNTWICRCGRRSYHHAHFEIADSPESIRVRGDSDDQLMHVKMTGTPRRTLSPRSIFHSKDQLRQILQEDLRSLRLTGPACYRSGLTAPTIWRSQLVPLKVTEIESSVFQDPERFLGGAAEFDSAYWLRDDEAAWSEQGEGAVCCDIATA